MQNENMRGRKCGRLVHVYKKKSTPNEEKKVLNAKFFVLLTRNRGHAFFLVVLITMLQERRQE